MDAPLDHTALVIGLFGGLALFLFGMDIMTDALKRAAGAYLKDILARLTRNRFTAVAAGAFITGIVNSSSVTTVILVGFITAGVMSMSQSVGVIMGANIGSTVTAQLLAFNISSVALPAVALGFLVSFVSPRETIAQYGRMLLGFGLVFYGMGVMSDAMQPLRSYQPFLDMLARLDSALLGVLAGALFTAVIQSSAATTGIVIVMAGQGLLDLETGIAIALGANIGTCMTAGLAVIGKPREAVRAAAVHLLFNIAGVVIWIGLIGVLADLVRAISPNAAHLQGAARVAAEAPRQLANAHTVFNIANTLIMVGFTTQIARFVEWLIPDRPIRLEEAATPKFLDRLLLGTPSIALQQVRFEIERMGVQVVAMLSDALDAASATSIQQMDRLAERDKSVDALHRAIVGYLAELSASSLREEDGRDVLRLLEAVNLLEFIGDRIAINIRTTTQKRLRDGVVHDPDYLAKLGRIHGNIVTALSDAIRSVSASDPDLAREVVARKTGVNRLRHAIERDSAAMLRGKKADLTAYMRAIELLEILDGIFRSARAIATTQLDQDGDEETPAT
ncbi:MAG: Na/Pi cotransporter family protein [Rhodobacteraceae bacterium]|nr:Na/Pi cotransporter family protein [Paracoccaceae bacterium]